MQKPWESGTLDLFNSKEVKMKEGEDGGDVVRRQEVVWIMEGSKKI